MSEVLADGLKRARPSEVGVDADAVSAWLDELERAGLERQTLLIYRGGALAVEVYRWPYAAERVRMTHSATKSFTSAAVGLALAEGRFRLGDKVAGFFPEHRPPVVSERLAMMTVEDLLTMRTGQEAETSGGRWRGLKTSWIAEFFRIPVLHEPGTTFLYTSAASYMLSAIVTRATGMGLHAYLRQRVFEPLGFCGERWDFGPDGVNSGGNGLSCRVVDMLKFGVLHLESGMWRGRRLLPEAWVQEATRSHGDDYGYQWWTGPEGEFTAMGLFGQMIVALPRYRAVIATTSAIHSGEACSRHLLPMLRRYAPAVFAGGSTAADVRLTECVEREAQPWVLVSLARPVAELCGQMAFRAEPNELGIEGFEVELSEETCVFRMTEAQGCHTVTMGMEAWLEGETDMPGARLHHGYELKLARVVAGARWLDSRTLEMVWIFVETSFRDTVVCRFDGEQIRLLRSTNVNSSERQLPEVVAVRVC